MTKNLYNWPTTCAAPMRLAGCTWDRLDAQEMMCMEQNRGNRAKGNITIVYKCDDQCNRLEMSRATVTVILQYKLRRDLLFLPQVFNN